MGRYSVRRLLQMVPTVLGIVVFAFFLIRLAPGDPALAMAGENADPVNVEAVRAAWGLDQPLWSQFVIYVGNLLRGDLGFSFAYHRPVAELVMQALPLTILLMATATAISFVLGVLIGTFSASRYPSKTDSTISIASVAFYSMPVFWLGMILVYIFSTTLGWFPSGGAGDIIDRKEGLERLAELAWHLVLPVVALAGYNLPLFLRITRASVIDTLRDEYVTTARAVGLSDRRVFYRHALRNALLPTVTMLGLVLGFVFTGAILTETVFSWPGVGRLTWTAIESRDYPTLMGVFVVSSVAVVVVSFLTDIAYAILDPRVTFEATK